MAAGRSTLGWRAMKTRAPAPGPAGEHGDEARHGSRVHTCSMDNPHTPTEAQSASQPTTGLDSSGRKANRVLVLGSDGMPLDPCEPARARKLLKSGRARRHAWNPFTIQLIDRHAGDGCTIVHEHEVRVDPGQRHTGLALVMKLNDEDRVVWAAELQHPRGISVRITQRRTFRRRRRGELRYRPPRFDNRSRSGLPPSINAVVQHTVRWLDVLQRRTPVRTACVESARFDTQRMQNPEIEGVKYQQGTLAGSHTRAYVRVRDGARCMYCGVKSWESRRRFTLDHVIPRTHGGSNRPSNLVYACMQCNQAKGKMRVEDFLCDRPEQLRKVLAQRKPPLAAATHTAQIAAKVVEAAEERGVMVRTTTGADTAFARRRQQVEKSHANDAAFAGADPLRPVTDLRQCETWKPTGHGRRKQTKGTKGEAYRHWRHLAPDQQPRRRAPGHARTGRTVHGIRTGDTVRIRLRDGTRAVGRATVSVSSGRVATRTQSTTRSTREPGRIRLLQRKAGWMTDQVSNGG